MKYNDSNEKTKIFGGAGMAAELCFSFLLLPYRAFSFSGNEPMRRAS